MRIPRACLGGAVLAFVLATASAAFAQGDLYGIIDAPAINGTVTEPFQVRGWAFWTGATSGSSGIDAVTVYGCPINNCPTPTFWGAATIGLARPDVAAAYNNPAGGHSGYSFTMSGLAPDTYFVQVWTHNTANGYWLPFNTSFAVTVPAEHVLEHPTANQALTQPFTISGWAIDANAPTGTGVDIVGSFAYPHVGSGEAPYVVGQAVYGDARTDVAAARGQRFLNSGYHLAVSGQSPGEYLFVVSARSTTPGNPWTAHNINVTLDTPTVALTVNRGGTGTGAVSATGLTCPGGSNTQALPCGTSYALNTTVTLTAVPDAGSTFTGWNGACQTTQPACTVTLTGNRDVFATFTQTAGAVATTYYHTDAIGSVRALSDDTGVTVIRHDYLPFGEDTQPLTGDPMRFAGKELDPESALMNFEARYYRNTSGRFTQVDPIGGTLTDTQSWNRYAYARNNPMAYVDPTGLEFTCAVASAMTCADTSTVSAVSASAGPVDIFPGGIPKIGTGAAPVYWVATHATNPNLVAEGFCGGMTDDILYTTWSCPENSGSGGLSLATSAQATTPTTPTTTTTTTTDTPTNPTPAPTPTPKCSPVDATATLSATATVGGNPFLIPAVFGGVSVNLGVNLKSGQFSLSISFSGMGGAGAYAGAGGSVSVGTTHGPQSLFFKSTAIHAEANAAWEVGGGVSADYSSDSLSVGRSTKAGLGYGLMTGIGGSVTFGVATPSIFCR